MAGPKISVFGDNIPLTSSVMLIFDDEVTTNSDVDIEACSTSACRYSQIDNILAFYWGGCEFQTSKSLLCDVPPGLASIEYKTYIHHSEWARRSF